MCAAIQKINNKIRDYLYITKFSHKAKTQTSNQLAADQPNNSLPAGTIYHNTIKNEVVAKVYIRQFSSQFHLATTFNNQN